jgi:hypothetical protein
MKNYVGISRDHSLSMSSIALAAGRDYNDNIASITESSVEHGIDTIVSVVKCGVGVYATVEREIVNSAVSTLKPIPDGKYIVDGRGTPLLDSVGDLITQLELVPDANDPGVAFMVMVITDGGENASQKWTPNSLKVKMDALRMTDRWTFTFRVPRGHAAYLTRLGIPAGNILEWDQSDKGVQAATVATRTATKAFYAARATGATSTDKFYADLSTVSLTEVKKNLVDISGSVNVFKVKTAESGIQIKTFVEQRTGKLLVKGSAFYQLTKTESVQDYKQIAIRDKLKGTVFSGFAARDMLGLPQTGEVKLAPGKHGQYDIFIQSTSVNRKLIENTNVLVWANA